VSSSFRAGMSFSLMQMCRWASSMTLHSSCHLAFPGPFMSLTFSPLPLVVPSAACTSFCKSARAWFLVPWLFCWLDSSGFWGEVSAVMTYKFPVKRHKCKNLTDPFVLPPGANRGNLRV